MFKLREEYVTQVENYLQHGCGGGFFCSEHLWLVVGHLGNTSWVLGIKAFQWGIIVIA